MTVWWGSFIVIFLSVEIESYKKARKELLLTVSGFTPLAAMIVDVSLLVRLSTTSQALLSGSIEIDYHFHFLNKINNLD